MAEESDFDERTLFIGNLDNNVDEEILYELFLQAGPVERVSVPCSNSDSFRYGFVTYKHPCSINYAIELYKGTVLFKKEIKVKRKGLKGSNNGNTSNNKNSNTDPSQSLLTLNFKNFNQEQLCIFQQAFLTNGILNTQPWTNFMANSKGQWPRRNKPYNRDSRNNSSRRREMREQFRCKDYGNKNYRDRKNRHY